MARSPDRRRPRFHRAARVSRNAYVPLRDVALELVQTRRLSALEVGQPSRLPGRPAVVAAAREVAWVGVEV